jgi:benzoyl-CoA 2,3-dioxygenase component B
VITEHEIPCRLRLPDRRFHRHIGAYAAYRFDPAGHLLTPEQWNERRDEFLPGEKDFAYVRNLNTPVMEIGKIAHWISKPTTGIHGMPFEFEYVRREQ